MTNLLSSISHELRTPLSGIMTQLECALSVPGISQIFKEKYLLPCFNCSKLLNHFICDIMDFVEERSKSNQIKLEIKPLNIKKVVQSCVDIFQLSAA